MIKFDYKLEQDFKSRQETFKPLIPKELPDIALIEAPNAIGKSALLNILALGLFGAKNKAIHNLLREKIRDLLDSDSQKLTFNFEISNEKNNLRILSKKSDPKNKSISVKLIKDGKEETLSSETFNVDFKLVYDIPIDPIGRLKGLPQELREQQNRIGERAMQLNLGLGSLIEEIKKSRDPNLISKLQEEKKRIKSNLEKLENRFKNNKNLLFQLKKYTYSKFFISYQDRLKLIRKEIRELDKESKNIKSEKIKIKKEDSEFLEMADNEIYEIRNKISEVFSILKKLLPKEKQCLEVWQDMDVESVLMEAEEKDVMSKEIEYFENKLNQILRSQDESKQLEASFFRKLINLLKDYRELNIIIPGVKRSISDFIEILQEKFAPFELFESKLDGINKILENLDNIKVQRDNFIKNIAKKVKGIKGKRGKTILDTEEPIVDLNKQKIHRLRVDEGLTKSKAGELKNNLIKINFDPEGIDISELYYSVSNSKEIEIFKYLGEEELYNKINDLDSEQKIIKGEINKKEYREKIIEKEIENMKKKKVHKYRLQLNYIDGLFKKTQRLFQKIGVEFQKNLNNLIEQKIDKKSLTPEQNEYFKRIGVYLAKRLKVIPYIDQEYKLKEINVLDDQIITDTEEIIPFSFFSTGQAQSAYLKGLIESTEGRKLIVFLDEVSTMDKKSMKPIIEKMRNLYKKGDLVAGIIAQKSDKEIRVTSLI